MITDIPTHTDFEESGVYFLNIAWDAIMSLVLGLDDALDWDNEVEERDYWQAAQKSIATSLVVAQQGTEFLLKGRIAEVSPFLLIAGTPRDWPKGCDTKDIPFADFRTIDAQDLIRVHKVVSKYLLPESFIVHYETLRRIRNSIMHTVDKRIKNDFVEVILAILEIFQTLVKPNSWFKTRGQYLENHPNAVAYSDEYVNGTLVREGLKLLVLLKPSETKKYFNYNKKQRSYVCTTCAYWCREMNIVPSSAQLIPNTPESTTLLCFICGEETKVIRKKCLEPECKGNVLDAEDESCLLCY